jgi:membrane associated rhomboid family serine protease
MRPTCPECQRPAAVGIQCVDCVAEGAKTVRQVRTVFGGAVTDGRPVATMTIIGICVAVFIAQQAVPGVTSRVMFVPALGLEEPWRFLTSAFAHGSLMHIAFNMYALWVMGTYLEPMLGRARFVALYLLSALGGSVAVALLSFTTPVVGASGAIFGLFGALIVIGRHIGANIAGIAIILAVNLVIGFIPGFNVSWQAHVGGLVVGALVGLIYARTRSVRRRALQVWLLVALTLVLFALLLVPPAFYF